MGNGQLRSFDVFYDRVSYRIGEGENGYGYITAASNNLPPIYRQLFDKHPDLVFWQITIFDNGLQSIYPGVDTIANAI